MLKKNFAVIATLIYCAIGVQIKYATCQRAAAGTVNSGLNIPGLTSVGATRGGTSGMVPTNSYGLPAIYDEYIQQNFPTERAPLLFGGSSATSPTFSAATNGCNNVHKRKLSSCFGKGSLLRGEVTPARCTFMPSPFSSFSSTIARPATAGFLPFSPQVPQIQQQPILAYLVPQSYAPVAQPQEEVVYVPSEAYIEESSCDCSGIVCGEYKVCVCEKGYAECIDMEGLDTCFDGIGEIPC